MSAIIIVIAKWNKGSKMVDLILILILENSTFEEYYINNKYILHNGQHSSIGLAGPTFCRLCHNLNKFVDSHAELKNVLQVVNHVERVIHVPVVPESLIPRADLDMPDGVDPPTPSLTLPQLVSILLV